MADPSTSINDGEVWGVSNKWSHYGAGSGPSVVCFTVGGIGDMDRVEERMCGVVGNETSWRDGILVLGCFIVDL